MRKGKAKRPASAQRYSLPIQLQQLNHSACRTILVEFVRFMQFARGQTYIPIPELDQFMQSLTFNRPKQLPSPVKRLVKYHTQLQKLLDTICGIPGSLLCSCPMFILLGQSCYRPKEVYHIQLTTSPQQAQGGPAGSISAASIHATPFSRGIIREMVLQQQTIPQWDAVPVPTKMFLLLHAAPGTPVPPGFRVQPAYQLKLHKGFQVSLRISDTSSAACLPTAPSAAASQAARYNGSSSSKQEQCAPHFQQVGQQVRDQRTEGAAPGQDAVQHLSQQLAASMQLEESVLPQAATAAGPGSSPSMPGAWYICQVSVKGVRSPHQSQHSA